ncbi:hypothetical protein L6164_037038 [Bauhinia variegata]|uniref:Uncharacterized protein n=1 Tax=Bauhinia variegata TaxID=167791 RepID=A0ACB9KIU7_BAUVA|nr:hypothetical protein L6164_037038 [Bauhinia variegata]
MPSFLSYQHALEYIDLSRNNLVGMFPNWLIENNSKLEFFFLNDNSFNRSFQLPTHINQSMDKLVEFDISDNKIHGSIPTNIGFFFPSLRDLTISNNKLDGELPASIGEMLDLRVLNLAHNNLSGEIPKQILQGCTSLFSLKLSHNNLQGQIFPIASTSLLLLMVDNNQFNGTIEKGIISSMGLWVFDISNNKLSGRLPANWPMGLGFLSVSSNNFEGEIPKELCELNLVSLDLSQNRFFGSIPSCFKMFLLSYY